MNDDLEFGGNDQLFNMMAGRGLVRAMKAKEKYVLATKLLVDAEGKKVGKTTGNDLFLDSTPEKFYAGVMSFPDSVIELGFELLTELPLEGLDEKIKKDPMGEKKHLAFEIVKLLWGEDDAIKSQNSFEETFQERKPEFNIKVESGKSLSDTITYFTSLGSKSEAKRLIKQKAVDINGEAMEDPSYQVKPGDKIKVGNRTFLKAK
jgi:tyrosyl-tRNA synthetase